MNRSSGQDSDVGVGTKLGKIGRKCDKYWIFFRSISVHVLKYDMKNPGFVPFGDNLPQFGATPAIPAPAHDTPALTEYRGVRCRQ